MKRSYIFMLVAILSLVLAVPVAAAGEDGDEVVCEPVEEAGSFEGTVIGADEDEGTVDLLLEDGTCVTLTFEEGDYDHPIVELLAEYFGGALPEDFLDALEVVDTEDGFVIDIEENDDGTWTVTYLDGTEEIIDDEDLADDLSDALDDLAGDFEVTEGEDGSLMVPDVGEQIEQYHEDGIGFGVLVKLYAIAAESQEACMAEEEDGGEDGGDDGGDEGGEDGGEDAGEEGGGATEEEEPCGVTVEELIEMYLNGMGMGQIFKLYGKPTLLGVGHVKQALDGDGSGSGKKGICNAREKGGNANAKGQDVDCP